MKSSKSSKSSKSKKSNQTLNFLLHEHKAQFTIDKVEYHSVSQWISASKATLFRDEELRKKIMNTESPQDCEYLSNKISGYNSVVWSVNIHNFIYRGLKEKLLQHPKYFLDFILLDHKQLGSSLLIKLQNELLDLCN